MRIYTEKEISKKLDRKKRRNLIIKTIVYLLIILILISNIILLIKKINNPQGIPSIFGYKMFVIVSGSMEPNIKIGDIVVVKETSQNEIKKDDVITFTEAEYQVTHRVNEIIEKDGQIVYQTKGDANNSHDNNLVKYENIEGKYVFKITKLGLLILKAQNPIVIIGIAILVYIIYAISSEKDDRKAARSKKRKEYEEKQENNK